MLYVKTETGRYRSATPAEVFQQSRIFADDLLLRGQVLNSPSATSRFLVEKLQGFDHEVFSVIFLDSQLKLIEYKEMFHGTIDAASVYPREVVKAALLLNAKAVVLSHNHPSGNATPSDADKKITRHLVSALGLLDVRVIDHIIVARTGHMSFAEAGLL